MDSKVLDPPMEAPPRRSSFFRSFLPFWITLVLGTMVTSWDYHRRHAPLTLLEGVFTIEGKPYEGEMVVLVDGKQQRFDRPIPIGNRRIQVATPTSEHQTIERFVWYGPVQLGHLDFRRLRGVLEVRSRPPADRFVLNGLYAQATNSTGFFPEVPAGDYELEAYYGENAEQRTVRVLPLRTNRVELLVGLGSLQLDSDPSGSEFVLTSKHGNWTRRGTMPAQLKFLPTGDYRVAARRDSFRRETNVVIRADTTNQVFIQFQHGSVEIQSQPEAAEVFWEGISRGVTPFKKGELLPGTYAIELRKEGFDPIKGEIRIGEGGVEKRSIALVNTQHRIAVEQGKRDFDRRDFASAVRNLEEAVRIQPDSPEALKLLPQARAAAFREEAIASANKGDFDAAFAALDRAQKEVAEDEETNRLLKRIQSIKADVDRQQTDAAERKRQAELTARRRQAAEAFDQSLADETRASEFPTVLRRTTKSIAQVREACVKIGKANPGFKAVEKPTADPQQLQFKFGSLVPLLGLGNYARLHAIEIAPGETEIRFKMFVFVPGNGGPAASPSPQLQEGLSGALRATLEGDLK